MSTAFVLGSVVAVARVSGGRCTFLLPVPGALELRPRLVCVTAPLLRGIAAAGSRLLRTRFPPDALWPLAPSPMVDGSALTGAIAWPLPHSRRVGLRETTEWYRTAAERRA